MIVGQRLIELGDRGQQFDQRFTILKRPQTRGVGRTDIDRKVIGEIKQALETEEVILGCRFAIPNGWFCFDLRGSRFLDI